jgi:predicted nucleotidyltransferase
MAHRLQDKPMLRRFRSEIECAYGPRFELAILNGSRDSGNARDGSDYVIAVFLHDVVNPDDVVNPAEEVDRLADIGTNIL